MQMYPVPTYLISPLQAVAHQQCYYVRSSWDVEQCNWECSEQSDITMTNITVKNDTVVYMCMEVMICQSQMSPEMFMISQTHRMGDIKTHHIGEGIWRKLPAFWVTFAKPFLLKIQYAKPTKIIEMRTLHISVFVKMTNIIVKSYTVWYMCMEVIICQSERFPTIVMISQTLAIWGTSKYIRWE